MISKLRSTRAMVAIALVAITAVGCSNREEGGDATSAPATGAPSTEAPSGSEAPTTDAPSTVMFGDMASPCGPATDAGVPTIAEGQNGGDTLRLGTATDHGYEAAPGLTVEMLDAAEAFAGWCNAQGGVRGLPIEIVDLDGKLFNVPAATEQACAETFAMVGGGWVFDNQMYPRFHECGMVSFPGYAVTAEASLANGRVQPIPNPPNLKPASWFLWAKKYQAEAIGKPAIIYGDFVSTKMVAEQIKGTMAALGGFGEPLMIPTNPAGEANWTPFAQQLKNEGITMLSVVGEPGNMILLYKAMREVGYVPDLVLNDANHYSEQIVAEGNAEATEGLRVRTVYSPFEEADQNPALATFLEMMATYNPDGRIAGLGQQAVSAMLLFVQSANACLDTNDNVLERECVLAEAKKVTSWTAGGLHAESNPGSNEPPRCGLIMGVVDGTWQRVYPERGSADDNGNGWRCDEAEGAVAIEGDFGDTSVAIDPTRPN
ncbi:MAG: ABC transporter substrate-binding protein [Ilumatobacteraceae bacterium]|jgi:ABC-type branched-subunit amino acid transport system substrate-binding protein|nr:ABC transporter substrate-binding protein [Ilumatobacteraceae bacterium]